MDQGDGMRILYSAPLITVRSRSNSGPAIYDIRFGGAEAYERRRIHDSELAHAHPSADSNSLPKFASMPNGIPISAAERAEASAHEERRCVTAPVSEHRFASPKIHNLTIVEIEAQSLRNGCNLRWKDKTVRGPSESRNACMYTWMGDPTRGSECDSPLTVPTCLCAWPTASSEGCK